ncbi:hypothetical protein MNB_SV-14-3 [hydrothermal vent metagenome]|uniref:Prokaryotic metallothionein family protein n=1 Tax=hydrothermal vent metagenome TaxID=652676 RepID=A0A1W1CTC5_9ZZZZ
MLLRVILLIIIAGAIYRFFGGKIPLIDKKESDIEKDFGTQIEGTSKCAYCGVYMTEDDALIYHRKAYCSTECLEKSKR